MTKIPIEELLETFLKKGGRVNKTYLKDLNRNRNLIVNYLGSWYSGNNIRSAIDKAFAANKK